MLQSNRGKIVQHGRITRARSKSLSKTVIKVIDGTKRRIKKRRVNAPSRIMLRFQKLGKQVRFGTRQELVWRSFKSAAMLISPSRA